MVRLWDTETGACISRFTNKKNPLCVKFHPDEDKQNLFVAGTQDKKILCYDTNSGEVVQEYDRHLGAVNSITFVEDGRRMVTTSDDKSIRVWEWDIPVDMKCVCPRPWERRVLELGVSVVEVPGLSKLCEPPRAHSCWDWVEMV
jgi:pre-mRNA-processing factor 17